MLFFLKTLSCFAVSGYEFSYNFVAFFVEKNLVFMFFGCYCSCVAGGVMVDVLLEAKLGERLRSLGVTVATAESCCGGLIAHRITNVSGASKYFAGGVVSYSNEAKMTVLGVQSASLVAEGAVSEMVAGEMARGACEVFGTEYAVSCTGIAGPTGGVEEKPAGLVFIGVAFPDGERVERCVFEGDREAVKRQTADRAFEMLLEVLG